MSVEKLYYVYIVASKSRAIYIGMTAFLMARVLSHRAGEGSYFTRKYRIHRLVYYEAFHSVAAAIARETEIKKWRREKKIALIIQKNPTWADLAAEWGRPAVMRVATKADSFGPIRNERPRRGKKQVPHRRSAAVRNDIDFVHRVARANSRLVQKILPIQRIPLRRPESRVANNPAQFFFRRAVIHAGGADYVFFQHHRADVVAAEAQAHLTDFESLRNPA